MASRIQLRRGTAAQWSATNPILAQGEIGVETDTNKIKIGDGSSAYTSLFYASQGSPGSGLPFIWKRKLTDQSVASSVVLVNDDTLFFGVGINQVWIFELRLIYESGTTSDFKLAFTAPAGATIHWSAHPATGTTSTITPSDDIIGSGTEIAVGTGVGIIEVALVKGIVVVGGASGNVQFQFAQNVSNATAAISHAGSYLLAQRTEP